MPAAHGDYMHWHPLVEQDRFMTTAEVVEAQFGEPASTSLSAKFPGHCMGIPQLRHVEIGPGHAWKHQRSCGKPD
jgi:chorismate synthase